MLSKLIREKLKPVLFESIRLLKYTKRDHGGKPFKTFNVRSFEVLNRIVVRNEDEIGRSLNIKKHLNNVNSELQDIKHFVNSIFIQKVMLPGLYLYPVLANFANLSVLKIHCSTIQYSILQNLGEYFPKLKSFELYKVVLSKESTSSVNSNEIIFPTNLNYLSIWCVELTDISILSEPYNAVFNYYGSDSRFKFSIPDIYLPTLKSLQFLQCSVNENGLEEFLQTNPNLEELSIDTFSPNLSKYFNSLKSLHLDQLNKINNLENLIAYQNIKILKINIEHNSYYDKFEKVCLMCPSVEFLRFNIIDSENHQEAFNTYLVPILKKLPNLKTIELPIHDTISELININNLPQIERVIFEHDEVPYLDIYFEKNHSLKQVEFKATYSDINKEEFMEKYKSYSKWKFKFFKQKVKGYKIINQY